MTSYNLFNVAGESLKVLDLHLDVGRYSLREWTRKLVDEASRRKRVFGCLLRLSIMRLSRHSHCCWMNPSILMVLYLYFDIKIDINRLIIVWTKECTNTIWDRLQNQSSNINSSTVGLFSWQADRDDVIVTREALEAGRCRDFSAKPLWCHKPQRLSDNQSGH